MTTHGKVITANMLTDGLTVYLDRAGLWTPSLAEARLLTDEAEQERLMGLAADDVVKLVVVDPYLMDVVEDDDGPQPVSQRERIRAAAGPTIQYVFP